MLKYLNMTTAATFFIGHHSDYSSILLWPDSKQTRQCGQLILVFVSGLQRLFGHQQPIRHDMAEVCYVSAAFLLFVSDLIPLHYFSEPNPHINYHNRLRRSFRRGQWSFLSSPHFVSSQDCLSSRSRPVRYHPLSLRQFLCGLT